MTTRTPLILILLKIPVTILLYFFQYSGTLLFAPTYLYFLSIKSFAFSQKFESSSSFYAIFFIPRAILVAGGFAFAVFQMYCFYDYIVEQTHQEGQILSYITLISTIFCLSFLFRRGYKQFFEVWKFPQLKSVMEHLEILFWFLIDLISIILTIIVFALIVRIGTVISYSSNANKKQTLYLFFIWKMTYYSLFEDIGLLGYIFLHVFRWRLALTKELMAKAKYKILELQIVYEQVFHTLIEIIFSPVLLIMIVFSRFSRQQVLMMIKLYPIEMLKRIVFDNFLEFLKDELQFLLFAVGCIILPYKIKLIPAIIAYYNAIYYQLKQKLQIETKKHDLEQYLAFTATFDENFKSQPRSLQTDIIRTHFFDLIAFICFIPQVISIFYLKRLNQALKEQKLSYNYVLEARKEIKGAVGELNFKGTVSKRSIKPNVQKQIIIGFAKMLFDIPFYIMGLASIILAPWRVVDYRSNEYKKKDYLDRRFLAAKTLLNSLIDWLAIILFLPSFVLTFLYRGSYIKKTIKAIFQKDFKNSIVPNSKEEEYNNEFIFNNLQIFMFDYFCQAFFDLLYSPLFLITFLPIYTIKVYRNVLAFNQIKDYELTLSRRAIFQVMLYFFYDIQQVLLLAIIYLTYYQKGKYQKCLEFTYNQSLNKKQPQNEMDSKEKEKQKDKDKEKKSNNIPNHNLKNALESDLKQQELRIQVQYLIFYFILLDLISLIPRALILITFIKQKKYHRILSEKLVALEKQNLEYCDRITHYEQFKFKTKFIIVIKLVIQIIVAILCIGFSVISTWRIPFLVMIIKDKEFRKQITGKEVLKTPIHFSMIYGVTFISYILDLIYLPLLILSTLMSPLIVINYVKNISYRYSSSSKESLYNQIYTHKRIIFHYVFASALRDLVMSFKLVLIILTGIRIPFLILITKRNQLNFTSILEEYYSMVKPTSNRIIPQQNIYRSSSVNRKINQLVNKVQQQSGNKLEQTVDGLTNFLQEREFKSKKLTFRKCVNVSFVEMLKDLPIAIFSIFITLLFPWRLFSIIRLWKQTLIRIPLIEDEFGRVKLKGIRIELFKLFGDVFTYDFPCMVLNSILILSIYKIPKVIKLLIFLLRKTFRKKDTDVADILESFDYRKELKNQVKILWQEVQTCAQYATIYILVIRIPSLKRRLNRFESTKASKNKLLLYSLKNPIPLEDRPTRACMQTLSYNVYSKIAEFLDIKDLGAMLITNKKLYIFTKQELIWEHLFNNKYIKFNIHYYSETFKHKCIEGYKHEQSLQIGKPISEEIRDEIIGRNHIIFDEYLATIFDYPAFMANNFTKVLSLFFNKIPQNVQEYIEIKQRYNKPYFIFYLSSYVNLVTTEMIRFEEQQNLEIQQEQQNNQQSISKREPSVEILLRILYFFLNKFESLVYYSTLLPFYVLKVLNAGDVRMYQLLPATRENVIDHQVPVQPYARVKSLFYYFLQPIGVLIKLIFLQTLVFGCFEFKYFYLKGEFLESIFWPDPIFQVILQVSNGFLIVHYFGFLRRIFVFFRPLFIYRYMFYKVMQFTRYILNTAFSMLKKATKPLYDALVDLLQYLRKITTVFKFFMKLIKFIFRRIINLVNTIRQMIRLSKNGYYQLLTNAFFFLNKFNLIGDLLFTIFVFLWMFWPFGVAYYYKYYSLWISAVAISAVLMVKGYLLIKKISNK